jgi:hypothetical protein
MRGTALGSLTSDIVFGSQAELRGTLALNCGGNPRYQTIVTSTLIELVDCQKLDCPEGPPVNIPRFQAPQLS